jgi:hypothetical protein
MERGEQGDLPLLTVQAQFQDAVGRIAQQGDGWAGWGTNGGPR